MSGFFDERRVNEALEELAQADSISIFVGAGASMEVGLPSWPALIDRLLARVARDRGLRDDRIDEFVSAVKKEVDGVIGAATVVRAHFDNSKFRGDADAFIREALYLSSDGDPIPEPRFGPTARAVAELVPLWPLGQIEILTTNYDLLIERAIDDSIADPNSDYRTSNYDSLTGRGTRGASVEESAGSAPAGRQPGGAALVDLDGAVQVGGGPQVDGSRFGVRHLHGALHPMGDPSRELRPIVIAEADYHRVQGRQSWQHEFLLERLSSSTCIFVGASMTDVNVLRFLRIAREAGAEQRHLALLTRGPDERSDDAGVNEVLRDAVSARWAEYGVEVLYPEFFLETSQFLQELRRRRRAVLTGGPLTDPEDRFRARLQTWERAAAESILVTSPPERLAQAQDLANEALRDFVTELLELLPVRFRGESSRETFGLQLWVVQESGRELLLWASSTSSWRDASAFKGVPIEMPTQWLAVRAFCAGSPVYQVFSEAVGTRWHAALNVPLFLDTEPWRRLPVGVISLSEMNRHGAGILGQLTASERDAVVNVLEAAGATYLLPEPPVRQGDDRD